MIDECECIKKQNTNDFNLHFTSVILVRFELSSSSHCCDSFLVIFEFSPQLGQIYEEKEFGNITCKVATSITPNLRSILVSLIWNE